MDRMAALGAELVRVNLRWDLVAARRPARPRDPADAAYDWSAPDRVVSAARDRGITVLMTIWGTPAWAADPRVPASPRFPARATRPADPGAVGRFAAAAARRYAPRGVRLWEAWNEPNLPLFLRPQHARRGGRWTPVSPGTYATMLRSVYREVKRVDPDARVGGGVTAPAGDACPARCPRDADDRVPPARFVEELAGGEDPPPMDAYSHHPYPVTAPRAETAPGASYIDLYNLGRLREALDATPLARLPLWLSEVGLATAPTEEYPLSFGEDEQARLLGDAHRRVAARRDVEILTWYPLQDGDAWRSGLVRADGTDKPAAAAHRLPSAPEDPGPVRPGEEVGVAGQVRGAGGATEVVLQRRGPGGWATVGRAATTGDGTFRAVAHPPATGSYRVVWEGGEGAPRAGAPFRIEVGP